MLHGALKLEKSAISKVQKHLLAISKMAKKSIFAQEKSLKLTKNAIFGLFSSANIDFLPFLKMKIMCFCNFEIALFFEF